MDKYGYIGIETLLNFCENSKDHSVTPNDFMRMKRVRMPEQKKKGKWTHKSGTLFATCSECGVVWGAYTVMNYCPDCGADMRGEQDK